jgi:DNA transformation protein
MTASDGFAEFLRDQLAPLGRITMRRMFGKTGVFCDGFMLGRRSARVRREFVSAPLSSRPKTTIDIALWSLTSREKDLLRGRSQKTHYSVSSRPKDPVSIL